MCAAHFQMEHNFVRVHNKICDINIFCATESMIKSTFLSQMKIDIEGNVERKIVYAIRYSLQHALGFLFDAFRLDMNWYHVSDSKSSSFKMYRFFFHWLLHSNWICKWFTRIIACCSRIKRTVYCWAVSSSLHGNGCWWKEMLMEKKCWYIQFSCETSNKLSLSPWLPIDRLRNVMIPVKWER